MAHINRATPGFLPVASRPRCRYCGLTLRPKTKQVGHLERRELTGDVKGYTHEYVIDSLSVTGWGYRGENLFCSLTCGYFFACRSIRSQNQQGV